MEKYLVRHYMKTNQGENIMKICDAHVHLGESGPWQPYENPTIYVDELIRLFDKYEVEQAIVFPNPNVGDKYPEMNNYIAEKRQKISETPCRLWTS